MAETPEQREARRQRLGNMSPEAREAYQSRIARRRRQKAKLATRKKAQAGSSAKARRQARNQAGIRRKAKEAAIQKARVAKAEVRTETAKAKAKAKAAAEAKTKAAAKAETEAAKKITVKVGAVEATVDAGADKKLGTEDDTVKLAKAGTADYSTMLVKQLREAAKERSIPGYSKMTKANLVKALRKYDKAQG